MTSWWPPLLSASHSALVTQHHSPSQGFKLHGTGRLKRPRLNTGSAGSARSARYERPNKVIKLCLVPMIPSGTQARRRCILDSQVGSLFLHPGLSSCMAWLISFANLHLQAPIRTLKGQQRGGYLWYSGEDTGMGRSINQRTCAGRREPNITWETQRLIHCMYCGSGWGHKGQLRTVIQPMALWAAEDDRQGKGLCGPKGDNHPVQDKWAD